MSETATAFELWWEAEPVGARFVLHEPAQDLAEKGWNAALEWAAGQVEKERCVANGACPGGYRPEQHIQACPIRLAAKIREGAT